MEQKWISIKKQLPETEAVYLAFFDTPHDKFVETVFFYQGKFVLPGRSYPCYITHWMQLPDFPTIAND